MGSTIIPVTLTYDNGSDMSEDSTITFKDDESVLLDNVPISKGLSEVNMLISILEEHGQFKTQTLQLTALLDNNLNDEYLIGDNVVLNGTATSDDNPYTNSPVIIIIDGTRYTTNTDNEGNSHTHIKQHERMIFL